MSEWWRQRRSVIALRDAYDKEQEDDERALENTLGPEIRSTGRLTRSELKRIAWWKFHKVSYGQTNIDLVQRNTEQEVQDAFSMALRNTRESERLMALDRLSGVSA